MPSFTWNGKPLWLLIAFRRLSMCPGQTSQRLKELYAVVFVNGSTEKVKPKNCYIRYAIQFSSVTQLCPTLCDPMNCSMSGLPVHHQLPESTQTHIHWLGDAIQPSHPLSSPPPPALNPSQHQGLFQWVSSSHQVAKVLESDIICVSEVVDISPGNLNSSLCFIQPSILHDVFCIKVK